MSDNLKELLEKVLIVLFISFMFMSLIWLIIHEPSYDRLIKVCEKTGMFYVDEKVTIKCEILK